jgi:D-3-phosphoglycerate dehydrogenase
MDFLAVADAFINETHYIEARRLLEDQGHTMDVVHWGPPKKVDLEAIIRGMEKSGPKFDNSLKEVSATLGKKPGLLVDFCPVPAELLRDVKIVGVTRANTSNVDMAYATGKKIPVIGVAGRNATAVAEFTVGLMIAESRHITRSHVNLMRGTWTKEYGADPNEIEGKTVGIIGFGAIGRAVAARLSGFGCRIIFYDPFVAEAMKGATPVSLDMLLAESDFVTIHVKVSKDTRHMIGMRELQKMKPSAFFINTARSEIVDEDALAQALSDSRIRGAALDVFVDEPLPTDSPFLKLPNVTLTPHMAGATQESLSKSPILLVRNILKYLSGDRNCNIQNRSVLGTGHA